MKVQHTEAIHGCAEYVARQIYMQLGMGMRVLWLVSGGSTIAVAAAAARIVRDSTVPLERLTVTLADERYGPVGHADANWAALERSGFTLPGAVMHPILTGATRAETTRAYAAFLEEMLTQSDYRIGLFGIGADGHTAGILPHSNAATSTAYAETYDAGAFERITMTVRAIDMLQETVAYAVGEEKWPALATLIATKQNVTIQPAQALKHAPHATLFSDYQ